MSKTAFDRRLDYVEGDEVVFTSKREAGLKGFIEAVKLSKKQDFFVFSVCVMFGNGIRFIDARPDQIERIQPADE